MASLAIQSQRVITPEGIRKAVVLVRDGRILDVEHTAPGYGFEIIDVGELVLMPGVIDPHVHINEPGRTGWEGFDTATRAAIAGGITTLVDMPLNSSPVTTTKKAFEEKLRAAEGKLHSHCGFWGGIVPGNENEIKGLISKGVLGFKAFLTHSGIDEFPNVTEADLRKAMPIIASHGLPLLVHCELEMNAPLVTNKTSYDQYLKSRPRQWEDEAIKLMIRLCEEFGCRVHIVHLSSSGSIPQIREAKQKGLPITVETAQHYLYFNAEDIGDGQTILKCAPPIREIENNQKLWDELKEGVIDFVATDHSPSPPEGKEMGSGDFSRAWGGISELQLALPVLWTVAKQKGGDLVQVVKWLCTNPALLAGLDNRKGKIQKGYDADLIVWNPEKSFEVTEASLHHKHRITPYMGKQLFGVVEQTFLNGEKVFDGGTFTGLNKGQFIRRAE